jgi:DNA-binding response OmpR family regulator
VAKCHEKRYDVVTMDLVMPNMDGATAIRAIREIQPETVILVFSGYPDSFNLGLDSGATRVLAKPMTMTELEKEVRALLREPV